MKVRFHKKRNTLRKVWYLFIDGKRIPNYLIEHHVSSDSYMALGPTVATSNLTLYTKLSDAKRAILEKYHDMSYINISLTIEPGVTKICVKP